MKKPLVAAVLNVYPGMGYLYLDAKQFIGWLVYFVFTFAAIGFYETAIAASDKAPHTTGFWVWLTSVLILWVALIVDAYRAASRKSEDSRPTNEQSIALTGIWSVRRSNAIQDAEFYQPVQSYTAGRTAYSV